MSDGKQAIPIENMDPYADLSMEDLSCPSCGGHAVIVYPRMKVDTYWPTVCFFCGELCFEFTKQERLERVERDEDWTQSMIDFLNCHIGDDEMIEILKMRSEEQNEF
jgi:hypothetical protein